MGIHGTNKDRITAIENDIAGLKRTLARNNSGAQPHHGRGGQWIATLQGDLEHGGTANATLYWFDGTNTVSTGQNVSVRDFFLGPGQAIPSQAKIEVEFLSGSEWYVTQYGPRPYFCAAKNDVVETALTGSVTFDNFILIGPNPVAVADGGFNFTGGAIIVENPGFYLVSLTIGLTGPFGGGGGFRGSVSTTGVSSVPQAFGDYGTSGNTVETRTTTGIINFTSANTAVNCTYTQPLNSEFTANLTFLAIDMDPLAVP